MKRFIGIVVVVLALSSSAFAIDLQVQFRDSLGGDDTTAIYRYDTVRTPIADLSRGIYFSFWTELSGMDTNWVEDTVIVYLEHAYNDGDNRTWYPIALDTFVPGAVGTDVEAVSTTIINTSTTALGKWGRGCFVFRDSIEAAVDLQGNVYTTECKLRIMPRD